MRKAGSILLTCILVASLSAGSAAAKPGNNGNGKGNGNGNVSTTKDAEAASKDKGGKAVDSKKTEKAVEKPAKESTEGPKSKEATEVPDSAKATNPGSTEPTTVTDAVYKKDKGHNGYRGLLKAIENVKDKPAGAVLANLLLTKYEAKLTPEKIEELKALLDSKEAMKKAADMLSESGSPEEAAAVQEEVIQADPSDLDSYKKLGELEQEAGDTSEPKLFVNGEAYPDAAPVAEEGSTLVPLRTVAEALDAKVTWNPKDKTVTVSKNGVSLKLVVDSKTAYVNGKETKLKVPASAKKGLTMIPMRFIGEALGSVVKWEPVSQSVVIYEPGDKTQAQAADTTAPVNETTTPTTTVPTENASALTEESNL
ncbi:copper amine oxidase [Paenibacillus sp. CAA11]|uniref:copper amine oxidase N-terminal domain-containing protein n=1 Tax=Paenibacillus sp. CAA11 TaxID=1532905 RepID=UPI000D334626|nr:copper amine oxidase N-terminal domain-containing protein [Paenibacillus sp. CAA11]AWB43301.1 copper amine oxidase [Paenibacillus sp. CAA11]